MAQSKNKSVCCVPLCTNSKKKQPYLHFHDFPTNEHQRQKWVRAIRRDEGDTFIIRKGSTLVCSRHFSDGDYRDGSVRLITGAVPSRFDWNNFTTALKKTSVYERVSARKEETHGREKTQTDRRGTEEHDYATRPPAGKHMCSTLVWIFVLCIWETWQAVKV